MTSALEMVIRPRTRDLGGFSVRRILPYATHRMVGPFVFFDHLGPATFAAGEGIDVRPHPHINLATVTYLFEGAIFHRDSLGSGQRIEPGAINWMTAGRGIVHSERTPPDLRQSGGRVHGIQCWVALPREFEETEPSFVHHPEATLPRFTIDGVQLSLLLGSALGQRSPVQTHSDMVYLSAHLPAGTTLHLPAEGRDLAAYVIDGRCTVGEEELEDCTMAVGRAGRDLTLEAREPSHVMILGGAPLEGERHIWWNFVSSSEARIEQAKADWSTGRFAKVPGDEVEFIPLPEEPSPRGTIL